MKKLSVLILMLCYLLMTTGVVAVSHFCMDKLASVSFYTTFEKKCDKCGMQKDAHSCCNDKQAFVKITTDHFKAPVLVTDFSFAGNQLVFTTAFLLSPLKNGNTQSEYLSHPPPLLPGNDIYLANNVFRI